MYDRIGTPMRGWAQQVIEDLELRGDETVLDAGCGSGSVTFDLLEKLPRGRIHAVDTSAEMIASLTRRIDEGGVTNVEPIRASLTDFTLPEPVDAVFSNAVFHWITDDDALFGCLYRATKPGGRLRAQCGGYDNQMCVLEAVDAIRSQPRFEPYLRGFTDSKKYRTGEEATAALERAGWRDARASLFDAPVRFDDANAPRCTCRRSCCATTSPACPRRIAPTTRAASSTRRSACAAGRTSPTTCGWISGRRSSGS